MKVSKTEIEDCLIIEPIIHKDDRGFFFESFHVERYKIEARISNNFVQDNHSSSFQGILRGLHFETKKPQGKLVRCVSGSVYDVVVDIRPESKFFKKWIGIELSSKNARQLWIPPGLAHGFYVTSEKADVEYKCTEYYDPETEQTLIWNDPDINIKWPSQQPILSDKDKNGKRFIELF